MTSRRNVHLSASGAGVAWAAAAALLLASHSELHLASHSASRSCDCRCCTRRYARCRRGASTRASAIHVKHDVHVRESNVPVGVGSFTPQSAALR